MDKADMPDTISWPDQITWFCKTCQESVSHHHKPPKPSYDELVEVLKKVQHDQREIDGARVFEGTYQVVANVLERVRTGR